MRLFTLSANISVAYCMRVGLYIALFFIITTYVGNITIFSFNNTKFKEFRGSEREKIFYFYSSENVNLCSSLSLFRLREK